MRNKAYIIDGGIGRVISSIPVFEKLVEQDPNFIIVTSSPEAFLGNPLLDDRTYALSHKGLMKILNDYDIVSLEPYRVNEYYKQECNIIQAFSKEILGDIHACDSNDKAKLHFHPAEESKAVANMVEAITQMEKKHTVVFQPFGRSAEVLSDGTVKDSGGRSLSWNSYCDILKILSKLDCNILVMSDLNFKEIEDIKYARLPLSFREWCVVIENAGMFVGCDSAGQHIAHGASIKSIVFFGGTFPENTSYLNDENMALIDNGKRSRRFIPMRIVEDAAADISNKNLGNIENMKEVEGIIKKLVSKLPEPKFVAPATSTPKSCCPPKEPNSKFKKKKKGFDLKDVSSKG
jgi:hypothetical protein